MGIVQELLRDVRLPRVVRVRQHLAAPEIEDVAAAVREQLARPGIGDAARPGMRVAVAVGSRGIARIDELAAAVIADLKARGALPFVVPAMGSHGGATAHGQVEVLARLGVTEERVGCPVRSSMEVVEIGRLASGLPVRIDRYAHEADGIVVVNRVKPHTSFRGPSESGLVKMIAIGLGKQQGADACHAQGFGHMAENIVAMAEVALAREKILFGVAIVENALDRPMTVTAVPAREIVSRDRELLVLARASLARIPFDPLDVLVVDRIGKELSGTGMDPNVTGRQTSPHAAGTARIERIAVLDVTDATHGNGVGVGVADFTTRRLVERLDLDVMYANALTSHGVPSVRIPATLPTEHEAIQAAVKTCGTTDPARVRLARVRNTLHLSDLFVSEALLADARASPSITVLGEPEPMRFDDAGRLANRWEAGG